MATTLKANGDEGWRQSSGATAEEQRRSSEQQRYFER